MADSAPPPGVDKRVRYFNGEFLQEKEFTVEQGYQLDREHRQNRLLHGPGIAEGLTVTSGAPNQVTVGWGTAIDAEGRQIVLLAEAQLPLPGSLFNDKQGIDLYVSYKQEPSDRQDDPHGISDYTRWHEVPELTAVPPGEPYPGDEPPVLLARLSLDGNGNVTVDGSARSYTGARLPGRAAGAPVLRSLGSGRVSLASPLTVEGVLGPGDAQPALQVRVPAQPQGQPAPVSALQIDVGTLGTPANAEASSLLLVRDTGVDPLKAYFAVRGDGNVGIGTAKPEAKLHVAGRGGVNADLVVSGRLKSDNNDGGLWIASDRFVGGLNTNQIGISNGGEWRLVVLPNGNIGIGTQTPENAEDWKKVVDVVGTPSTKLSVRTTNIDARIQAHDGGWWGAQPGMVIGTKTNHALSFATRGSTRMAFTADGLLGIGTTVPNANMHLSVPGQYTAIYAMRLDVGFFGDVPNRDKSFFVIARDMKGDNNKPKVVWSVNGAGRQGVGTGNPEAQLHVAGDAYVEDSVFTKGKLCYFWESGGVSGWRQVQENALAAIPPDTVVPSLSDIRLKTGVRRVGNALEMVGKLSGIRFRWSGQGLDYLTRDAASSVSAGPGATDGQNREAGLAEERRVREALAGDRMGLVAQDVESVAPELVFENGDGYKHIRYQQLTALLVEAVKEQEARVRSLSATVEALQRGRPGALPAAPEGE